MMTRFEISLSSQEPYRGEAESEGVVCIGDTRESFTASHALWQPDQYVKQWLEAAARLTKGQPSCFVTDVSSRDGDYVGERWNAWPAGDVVTFQNQILVGAESGFDPDDPYASLPESAPTTTSTGLVPSTWLVPLVAISAWYRRITTSAEER